MAAHTIAQDQRSGFRESNFVDYSVSAGMPVTWGLAAECLDVG